MHIYKERESERERERKRERERERDVYENCSESSKPHPDFWFVTHLLHLYESQLHKN